MRRLYCCLALLVGCDAWSLSVNSDGFVRVTITGGDAYRPRDGYRLRVTRGTESYVTVLPANGELRLERDGAGRVTLALVPPPGCSVAAPRDPVSLDPGSAGHVEFALSCVPAAR